MDQLFSKESITAGISGASASAAYDYFVNGRTPGLQKFATHILLGMAANTFVRPTIGELVQDINVFNVAPKI